MNKRVLSGAAVLGVLLLGAATLPQEPVRADAVARQTPPNFRDVLRGRVGQECDAKLADGIWTMSFPARAEEETEQQSEGREIFEFGYYGGLREGPEADEEARNALLRTIRETWIPIETLSPGPQNVTTLTAVGQDFVQLRELDGTERFIPLARVDVVVRPDT